MQLQHNSKLKKHLTRALSLMLAFALALSTPLTTHADVGDSGDNTGGGGGGMSGSTSTLAWSSNAQGYRMYIIDKNFVRISPTYDFYYSTPSAGTYCWDTRFDGPSSPTEHYYADISQLKEWCDSEFDVPAPTKLSNGERVGNGQEFKEWFFAGEEGTRIPGGGNGSGGNGNNNTGGPDSDNQNHPNTVLASIYDHNAFLDDIIAIESGEYSGVPQSPISETTYDTIKNLASLMSTKATQYYNLYKSNIGKWLDYTGDGIGDYQITESDMQAYAKARAFSYYYDDFGITTCYALYIVMNGQSSFDSCVTVSNGNNDYPGYWDEHYGEELAHFNTTDAPSLLFQSIPLAGEEGGTGGGAGMPAYNLINKNNTIQVPDYDNAALALADGCYLVVEPITWLYVRTNNGPWDSPSTYESTRTYGTYWNLASKWVGTGGFYNIRQSCLTIV